MNTNLPRIVNAVLLALLALIGSQARAGTVTFDFTDVSGAMITANYAHQSFRFSPNCHYDVLDARALPGPHPVGRLMNFDFSACDAVYNTDFLGPVAYRQDGTYDPPSVLWVDRPGGTFGLDTLFVALTGWTLLSSAGGSYAAGPMGTTASFAGPEWSGLDWLMFVNPGSTDYMAFADLALKVPESGSLALVLLALAGAALVRGRARVSRWGRRMRGVPDWARAIRT